MTICDVNKIDSNVTGLSFAEEVCLRVLPSVASGDMFDPRWFALEPNSYADFGADLTTVARQPISASRQRSKGTVTDLQAAGGFNTDVTQNNMQRLLQGFFFNYVNEKPNTRPLNALPVAVTSVAASDKSFNAASGLDRFLPGHIVFATAFSNSNIGRKLVATATAVKLTVAEVLIDEAAPAALSKLEAVGFRFASGEITLTANVANAILAIAGLAAASGTLTTTGNALVTETVTIAGKVYTFVTATPAAANQVLVGANAQASLANLAAAINGGAGAGTLYGAATVAHTLVSATSTATTLVVTAKNGGTAANSYATTDTMTNGNFAAATLTGGAGSAGWRALGVQVGEWIFVGGDLTATQFATASSTNRPGYARVDSMTDAALTLDQSTWTPQTDAGAAKTIEVFFGMVLKNGAKLISYQFERTLGSDSVGVQSQYIKGAIANELTINFPTADKLNADLSYAALDEETRTGTEGLKAGARFLAPGESAINTSLDLFRISFAVVDPTTMNNQALFGFVTEAGVTIANNASPIKALGKLGAVDVSVGNFEAGGTITALFSSVAALRAIRNNADMGMNFITARANSGFVFDMPLIGVGGGRLNIELNSPVTIPLTAAAAQNKNGYTLLGNWFSYLPTVAMPQ